MSQEEEPEDKFLYDQPWNPVSYFEEENEATGGDPSGSAYSPSKLASLFETNNLAVDQDIAMRKRVNSQSSATESLDTNDKENTDLDTLSQYTLEVDNGIKILDTIPAINQKAIFHDLDRIRRWQESVDTPNKEVYINDEDTASYLYEITDNTPHGSGNNLIDLNLDYILNSLPDVKNLDDDVTNINCYGKLQELENQINEDDNLFSIGSLNTGVINTSVVSIISDKKINVTGEDSELIINQSINKIIVGDMLNDEFSINNISDLNRKNSENDLSNQNIENVKIEDFNTVGNGYLNNSLKEFDISDDLDQLFDDSDDALELPDVPEYLIDVSSENEGLTLTESDNNINIEHENENCNPDNITGGNAAIKKKENTIVGEDIEAVGPASTNTCENLATVTDMDDIDNTNYKSYDIIVEDVISSNETDMVDALIGYVEEIISGDVNTSETNDVSDNQDSTTCDVNGNGTNEHCMNATMCDTVDNEASTFNTMGNDETMCHTTDNDAIMCDTTDDATMCDITDNDATLCDTTDNAVTGRVTTDNDATLHGTTDDATVCGTTDNIATLCVTTDNDVTSCNTTDNAITLCAAADNNATLYSVIDNDETACDKTSNGATLCDAINNDYLAIENILDHIENNEINENISVTNIHDVGLKSKSNEFIEGPEKTSIELNTIEAETSTLIQQDPENIVDIDAGSSLNILSFDSRNNSFNSDDNTSLSNQIIAGDESNIIYHTQESKKSYTIEIKSNNYPIPIPKTVDVSSVHCKDSIGCLTPDDDDDTMVASSSGYNANSNYRGDDANSDHSGDGSNNGDNEPSTSTAGIEKEYDSDSDNLNVESSGDVDVDVRSIETEACSSLDVDVTGGNNDKSAETAVTDVDHTETVSTDTDTTDLSPSNIPEVDTLTNVDFENIDETGSKLDHELVAGSDNDAQPNRTSNTDNNTIGDGDVSNTAEASSNQEGAIAIDNTESNNADINDAVFDDPSISSNNTQTMPDTNHSEEVPGVNHPRQSGSIRRVRFSLDNEDPRDDQESTSISSGSSTEQNVAVSSAQGTEGIANTVISPEMRTLGWVAPKWIPDSDAKSCMTCNIKFTVVKRRHHCRACGKVLCSQCCNMKFHLPYMDYKPVRVCQTCCDIMITGLNGAAQGDQPQPVSPHPPQPPAAPLNFALPEAPPPYSESIDGTSERLGSTSSNAPPYTEAALPRFDEQPAEVLTAGQAIENLPVMRNSPFPNAPINDMMSFQLPGYSCARHRTSRNRSESEMSAVIMFNSTVTNLPPILRRDNDETRIINNPSLDILMKQMNDENEDPISFIVNKNLVVRVKVVNLDCCVEKRCWCFVSDGMGASNQEEVVVLIKCKSYEMEEFILVRKVLQQMNAIFEKAKHGNGVSDSEQMEFNPNIMCMPKNCGMLFYKPTVQCLKKLFLPTSPYLFGMYIEKSEVPWAKNFPLRLLLRIGAEYKYYPCPLFNVLDRPAVYEGVGRTILDLLADFRNFQYTLPRIVGVTINLRGKDTIIKLPRHRFDEVLKAVNASEENVLSLAGNFSPTCDGHLVSVEKDGRYKTQTLSIVLKENRKVTCASFFVMSAALKPDHSGIKAKASIVEDGVMVQVTSDVIQEFKTAIKEMKEYTITAGNPNAEDSSQVGIEWCTADSADRPKLTSPIDAKPFDNLTNMKIRHSYDYTSNNLTAKIHWVEVYFLPQDNDTTVQRLSARELGQMTSSIAKACMSALSPHLMTLIALEMTRIGLRVNLAANFVEYKIGANLTTLPPELLPTLDDKLVPAVHNVMSSAQERVAVELIFQLVKIV